MIIAWGRLLNAEERGKLVDTAQAIGADPSDLSACIYFESRWEPAALNADSGASGLIQFMPRGSALALSTTTEAIRRMTRVQQLDLVRRYFTEVVRTAGRVGTLSDLYMSILWPRAVGLPDEAPLFSADDETSKAYVQNKGLDLNKDGTITKAEATSFVARRLQEGLLPQNAADSETQPAAPIEDRSTQHISEPQADEESTVDIATILGTAAPIATAVNPLAGLVMGLASSLINAFAPLAKEKITKEMARHTDKPEVAAAIGQGVVDAALAAVGHVNPAAATPQDMIAATVAVQKDPALLQQVQDDSIARMEAYLKSVAPLIDRIAERDDAINKTAVEGKMAAMQRQLADTTGAAVLVLKNINGMSWFVVIGLMAAIVAAIVGKIIWKDMPDYLPLLIAPAGMIFQQIFKERGAVVAYYYDGTPTNNATTALNNVIVAAAPQKK